MAAVITVELASAEGTRSCGVKLGRALQPGDFVGLIGDLGAGKTHFARGVAEGCEVPPSQVASPTFAIVYPYDGRISLYHADLYRLSDADELYATGYFDLFGEGAMLVEWVDQVPGAAPPDWLRVELEITGDDTRRLRASAHGAKSERLLAAWLNSGP
jgi:tRNA threonylcarbamoyladenosine biosynthesis protein TsaE